MCDTLNSNQDPMAEAMESSRRLFGQADELRRNLIRLGWTRSVAEQLAACWLARVLSA